MIPTRIGAAASSPNEQGNARSINDTIKLSTVPNRKVFILLS
jgi:hypothetical protein